MPDLPTKILSQIAPEAARRGLKGLEREALRVTPDGRIAQTPHPSALGSALTHTGITTDFSEALLEFVTPPHTAHSALLAELESLEIYAAQNIGDERLWMLSMPCFIDSPSRIPIARYGHSNIGHMKHLYRLGLARRYGSAMQVISGVHFNYSFPHAFWEALATTKRMAMDRSARDTAWMNLVRNVQRRGWLLLYLFGASPTACPSFTPNPPCWLKPIANGSLAAPYATSLRLSDIGYKNTGQAYLSVSTNSLAEYIADLSRALHTEDPGYAALGVHKGGTWKQLSAAVLQIENEYYGLVRPKVQPRMNERPSAALLREGVHYVEVRALDIDPFTPLGITPETLRFLEIFLWSCILTPSPPIEQGNQLEIDYNQRNVAVRGREPGIGLRRDNTTIPLRDWGEEIIAALEPLAEHFDSGLPDTPYCNAVTLAATRLRAPATTPSARVLDEVASHPEGFLAWSLERSHRLTAELRSRELAPGTASRLRAQAAESLARQQELETHPEPAFETFLAQYYASGPNGREPLCLNPPEPQQAVR